LTVLHRVTDAAMTALQRHILQLAPAFNFETDAVTARISKFPTLKAELSRCTSQGLYIWQYSCSPPTLPALLTAPIAAAATADQVAPAREDAQFCWLAALVPVASLPASFIQQAPSWQERKVFVSPSSCATRCWCAAAFSVSPAASLVRCLPLDPFSLCQRRQVSTSVLQQNSLRR
jgi:hypothetical protein